MMTKGWLNPHPFDSTLRAVTAVDSLVAICEVVDPMRARSFALDCIRVHDLLSLSMARPADQKDTITALPDVLEKLRILLDRKGGV